MFLDIVERIYHEYMGMLQRENLIDFADMINEAAGYLNKAENNSLPYRYIIIDEFQDIARQRFILIDKLSSLTNAKVVAVGDDWQSIFTFAGSEVSLFTKFTENMGSGTELRINNTYRNSQELIDIAGQFIQKNSSQKKKRLISKKHITEPVAIRPFDDGAGVLQTRAETVEKILEEIREEFGERSSVLMLGRYGFDGDSLCKSGHFYTNQKGKILSEKYPDMNLTFMTAHGSKGLGSDNVIILNMSEGRYGFPCQIEDDPIMKLVRAEDNAIPFAEERRLFYVALTRTKNRVYVPAPIRRPSRFLVELINDCGLPYPHEMNMRIADPIKVRCPKCKYPLKYEHNKTYGLPLFICTNDPEVCGFMTNNSEHKHDIYKCPGCKDGYLVVRINKENGNVFYGCTNYYKTGLERCMLSKQMTGGKRSGEERWR
jgi:DNA helicase-4